MRKKTGRISLRMRNGKSMHPSSNCLIFTPDSAMQKQNLMLIYMFSWEIRYIKPRKEIHDLLQNYQHFYNQISISSLAIIISFYFWNLLLYYNCTKHFMRLTVASSLFLLVGISHEKFNQEHIQKLVINHINRSPYFSFL